MKTVFIQTNDYDIWLHYTQDEETITMVTKDKKTSAETRINLSRKDLKNLIHNLKYMKNLLEF